MPADNAGSTVFRLLADTADTERHGTACARLERLGNGQTHPTPYTGEPTTALDCAEEALDRAEETRDLLHQTRAMLQQWERSQPPPTEPAQPRRGRFGWWLVLVVVVLGVVLVVGQFP